MPATVVDDHLLRDILVGHRDETFDGLTPDGVATTGLWLFRLCSSFANPTVVGKLSGPVASLPENMQARFREQLVALPASIEVLSLRDMAWPMALLQTRHRAGGRSLSAAMVEALAAAHRLGQAIAVSHNDVGPNLQAAAEADGVAFHVL
ncbi:MAG TPA: hypothetical protein VM142_01935 [Acidimicrobiales bacterium]|nr:hypothetical protein [Acidimicrobiales bacterium]